METKEFGTRLRELRRQAGLSLRELADKIGINFTYLSKIESGVMPPPSEKVILRLAEVLDANRDELLVLAGKIPPDIAQILKHRGALQLLRSERTQRKIRSARRKDVGSIMRNLMNYKRLSSVAIAVVLVCAVAVSLWFVSPPPAKALTVSFPSLPAGTLGTTHSFTVRVNIASYEHVPITSIDIEIYNVADPTKKMTCTGLPLESGGTASYSGSGGTVSVTATAPHWEYFSGAGYALWKGTGYSFGTTFGYGYQTGSAQMTYAGTWTSPAGWPAGGYEIEVSINASSPSRTETFVETSSSFTLYAPSAAEDVGGGEEVSGGPPLKNQERLISLLSSITRATL